MINVISIATASYLHLARRLAVSLARTHPDWFLTLYCDDADSASRVLGRGPWQCVSLASIGSLGVKRAKFDAYADAIQSGPFVWLDADVIVLESLEQLIARPDDALIACLDDLSECDFITDPRHPWPAVPSLRADVYFNSGVFGAGAKLVPFFEACALAARESKHWAAWTIEGRLLDNHFLCAMVNRERIGVRELDSRQYNWQGLRKRGHPMIRKVDGRLVNIETGLPLHVAHFAGVSDVDAWLRMLPSAELACLARAVSDGGEDLLAALGRASSGDHAVDDAVKAAFVLGHPRCPSYAGTAGEGAWEARAVLSLLRSVPASGVRWNGLPCGGAYLEASEYAFLRSFVVESGIRTVVEVGAGYTSALFRRQGARVLSLESTAGPWVEAARAAGADVRLVPFDSASGLFEAPALAEALPLDLGEGVVDLLFIDSPIGTVNRRHLLTQLGERIAPRLVAFHDAHRDAEIVFAACGAGWQLIRYLPTWRGLVVLQRTGLPAVTPAPPHEEADDVPQILVAATSEGPWAVRCQIRNVGNTALRATGPLGWRLSYHLESLAPGGMSKWDNPRITLPCNLGPGDVLELSLEIASTPEDLSCWFDFVQEGVRWMSGAMPELRASTLRLGACEGGHE